MQKYQYIGNAHIKRYIDSHGNDKFTFILDDVFFIRNIIFFVVLVIGVMEFSDSYRILLLSWFGLRSIDDPMNICHCIESFYLKFWKLVNNWQKHYNSTTKMYKNECAVHTIQCYGGSKRCDVCAECRYTSDYSMHRHNVAKINTHSHSFRMSIYSSNCKQKQLGADMKFKYQ